MNKTFSTVLLTLASLPAWANLNIFATVPEWGALAKEIGGDKVRVYTATNAFQDPHRIEAKPSLLAQARQAFGAKTQAIGIGALDGRGGGSEDGHGLGQRCARMRGRGAPEGSRRRAKLSKSPPRRQWRSPRYFCKSTTRSRRRRSSRRSG